MAATQHTLLYSRRFAQVGTPSTSGKKPFKILSFNILAQCLVKRAIFPYTSGATLKWKLRKQNLLNELKAYDADICCLQELDQFDYWGPEFEKMGYDVLYHKKDGGQHGLGILWKRNRFNLIASEMIQLDNSPLTHPTPVYPITQNIALLAFLKDVESGESITISNHHLYWRPDATYVRTRQLYVILKNLVGFNAKCGGYRMLMCGGTWISMPSRRLRNILL
ncbi:Endonuclease/exonuclease/phosphatase [Paraphysoderma sedebokerense]|nr:Endonuclease/exonuclease/phosphatase [Paraphysoderma sedebokerense]